DMEPEDIDSLSDSIELVSGLTFQNWDKFEIWLHKYVIKEGFSYKTRTSKYDQDILKRAVFEYTKS
ncbi:468_t:CDS:1, partial [Racocetra persica]